MMLKTYNSKTGTNGQRYNLLVNDETKEFYFAGHNTFNKGNVIDGLGAREIKNMRDNLISEGYKNTAWEVAKTW